VSRSIIESESSSVGQLSSQCVLRFTQLILLNFTTYLPTFGEVW